MSLGEITDRLFWISKLRKCGISYPLNKDNFHEMIMFSVLCVVIYNGKTSSIEINSKN